MWHKIILNHELEVNQLNDPLPVHNVYHVTEVILLISSYLCAPKCYIVDAYNASIILKCLYVPIILKFMPA